jgi:hypothetical protein
MMGNNDMLNIFKNGFWNYGALLSEFISSLANHYHCLNNMANKLPAISIGKCHMIGEFFGFADIVQEWARQDKIGLDVRI